MSLVADVYWTCPGCNTKNCAQVYRELEDEFSYDRTEVPARNELRWNPPCKCCGKYSLEDREESESSEPTPLPIVRVNN